MLCKPRLLRSRVLILPLIFLCFLSFLDFLSFLSFLDFFLSFLDFFFLWLLEDEEDEDDEDDDEDLALAGFFSSTARGPACASEDDAAAPRARDDAPSSDARFTPRIPPS